MKRKLFLPVMNSAVNESSRLEYADSARRLGAKRIFIAIDRSAFFLRGENRESYMRSLRSNIEFFNGEGFYVGVWLQAFGFGDILSDAEADIAKNYTSLCSVSGNSLMGRDAFCPESEAFFEDFSAFTESIAKCRPHMIMLDDDLCLSVRPGIGCFCQKHLALIEAELGESLRETELQRLFFEGGESKYRSAWRKVMGKSHYGFARKVRESIDRVDPSIGAGFCAGYTSFDIEGFDVYELAKIYAGNSRPFVRLTGAPYWVARSRNRFENQPLGEVIECARSQYATLKSKDIEVFSEADSFPRPAYMVPASVIECFSTALCAEEGLDELFYPFDYYSSPNYEKKYINSRLKSKELHEFIEKHFHGKDFCGVGVADSLCKIEKREIPEGASERQIMRGFFNRGASLLATSGIPTVYGKSDAVIAVGEDARYLDLENIPSRLITDAKGAFILASRGFDAGFISADPTSAPEFELFENGKEKVKLWSSGEEGYYKFTLKEQADINAFFERNGESFPSEYTYKSGSCELLVYTFEIDLIPRLSALILSYGRSRSLARFCAPEAFMENVSGVYQICKRGDTGEYAVLFVNISEDPVYGGVIRLKNAHTGAELFGAEGELCGKELRLSSDIPPYGAFAVILN